MEIIKFEIPMWNIEEMIGYKPKTRFWQLFSVAETEGADTVRELIGISETRLKKEVNSGKTAQLVP